MSEDAEDREMAGELASMEKAVGGMEGKEHGEEGVLEGGGVSEPHNDGGEGAMQQEHEEENIVEKEEVKTVNESLEENGEKDEGLRNNVLDNVEGKEKGCGGGEGRREEGKEGRREEGKEGKREEGRGEEGEEGKREEGEGEERRGEEEEERRKEEKKKEGNTERGGVRSPDEREAYKSQLLKSAGIQLQGSEADTNEGALGEQNSQDRNLEQFSEILLDSDLSPTESETQMSLPAVDGDNVDPSSEVVEGGGGEGKSKSERRVRFADEVESVDADSQATSSRPGSLPTGLVNDGGSPKHPGTPVSPSPTSPGMQTPRSPSTPHTPEEIITGVGYSAEYLGSTPIMLTGNASAKTARMQQAQQVVKLFKDPENDVLPRFPVTVKISSQCIKIVDSTAGIDLMDHPLYTISYVADVENMLVIMINRILPPSPSPEATTGGQPLGGGERVEQEGGSGEGVGDSGGGVGKESGKVEGDGVEEGEGQRAGDPVQEGQEGEGEGYNGIHVGPIPRMTCHVLETNDARHVAMVIGQAFSVAYKQFLRATGISEAALEQAEYAHVLNAQSAPQAELDQLRDRNKTKKLNLAKNKGDMLGVMVMESGYGSALPTPVIAHLSKTGSAARSGQLNVGDHIISINGINLVGMPVKVCIEQLKKCRYQNLVKMTVVSCPTVVDITIVRPDLKFQLGFAIQDGVVCSLTRGSIAERSGLRVGHCIIEINGTSTVGLMHKDFVHLLTTTVGDLHLKTMPRLIYKLITGQTTPLYH